MKRIYIPRLWLGIVAACLLSASTAVGAAPKFHVGGFGTCVVCNGSNHCALINGGGSTGCTFTKLGCEEDFGICVCGNCGSLAPQTPENLLERNTPVGRLTLHSIGRNRFAAWSCAGELIALAERRADGAVVDLPIQPFKTQYRYETLLKRVASSTE
jgi:hypothetical protein